MTFGEDEFRDEEIASNNSVQNDSFSGNTDVVLNDSGSNWRRPVKYDKVILVDHMEQQARE